MVAVTVAERMTAAQFLGQPDRPGAEWLQLVEGEVVVTDPHARHNFAQGDLVFAFETWSRSKGGRGRAMLPLDVALDDLNVFEPDIAWYAEGRVPTRDSVRPFAMPDLGVADPTCDVREQRCIRGCHSGGLQLVVPGCGANGYHVTLDADVGEISQVADVNEMRGHCQAQLHQGQQRMATSKKLGLVAVVAERGECLLDRSGADVVERCRDHAVT